MATKMCISKKGFVKVDALKFKIGSTDKNGFYFRVFSVVDGKDIEMFPFNNDYWVIRDGSFTLTTSDDFKIKQKVEFNKRS